MIDVLAADWNPSVEATPYWTAAREGRLELPRCAGCGAFGHPAQGVCEVCGAADLRYEVLSGGGRVYSVTIVERALIPELRPLVPYALALVDLDEGPRLVSVIRDCAMEEIRIDMPVRVGFERVTAELTLPVFVPDPQASRP